VFPQSIIYLQIIKKKSLNDINFKADYPTTFESCWDIVNFIISNYIKDALLLTPEQFKYLLDIGLLCFNTNIKLLVIDHCQVIQNKNEYSLYSNIMAYYKEAIEPKTDLIEAKENNNDNNQKVKKKKTLKY